MKRERWLRLVPPPTDGSEAPKGEASGDEPPFTDDELREAAALRDALERGDAPVAGALKAAWSPEPLDAGDLDAILARALATGEEEAPPTRVEERAAGELREALDRGGELGDDAAVLGELRAAWRPAELPAERNEALITAALAKRRAGSERRREGRRILPMTMAAISGVAALAAGVALVMGQLELEAPSASTAPAAAPAALARSEMIRSRSTQELFDPAEKFPVRGDESARMDRIAGSRAADLRANRFAAWGVR